MFSPENQQVQICLLKSNLEEIENEIIVQRSALPTLDAENESKYRETMTALKVVRSLASEIERLKRESVRLTAKRMQLKQQCEDISRELERARNRRSEFENLLKQEEADTEEEISKYEDFLREIADRFRKTPPFDNEIQLKGEIESISKTHIEVEDEVKKRQHVVNELLRELDQLQPTVPENLLAIIGKMDLEEKLKAQSLKYNDLCKTREDLINCRKNAPRIPMEY